MGSDRGGLLHCAVNDTAAYHRSHLATLGWELTVCNALEPAQSPCRQLLTKDGTYGELLYDFLAQRLPLKAFTSIIEIGGGYGYLARDFLRRNPHLHATMLDISPVLLERQRQVLPGQDASFCLQDFLTMDVAGLSHYDLAIMNENLGDFPTLLDLPADFFQLAAGRLDAHLKLARAFFALYELPRPEAAPFHLNIGALQALEKLCSARIPAIFLVEHSCEATVPQLLQGLVTVVATGNPQRISLAGHDEYTLRFSQLERIASAWGYTTRRGPIADFLPLRLTDRLRNILAAPQARSDTQEIIRHFAGDLFQYEYLLLSLGSAESCWECLTTAGQDVLPCQRCGQCCLTNFIAYASPADTERWHREGRFDIIATVAHEHAAWMGDHFVSAEDGRYLHGCPFLRWRDGLHSCSIYETRPEVCRRYQPGSSELCSQWRKHGHQK